VATIFPRRVLAFFGEYYSSFSPPPYLLSYMCFSSGDFFDDDGIFFCCVKRGADFSEQSTSLVSAVFLAGPPPTSFTI